MYVYWLIYSLFIRHLESFLEIWKKRHGQYTTDTAFTTLKTTQTKSLRK